MFFSDPKKYAENSLTGKFEDQLRFNELKLHENKFEVLPFLNFCEHDTKWYNNLIDHLFERENKLKNPTLRQETRKKGQPKKPFNRFENTRHLVHYDLEESHYSGPLKCSTFIESKKTDTNEFEYNPRSPIEETIAPKKISELETVKSAKDLKVQVSQFLIRTDKPNEDNILEKSKAEEKEIEIETNQSVVKAEYKLDRPKRLQTLPPTSSQKSDETSPAPSINTTSKEQVVSVNSNRPRPGQTKVEFLSPNESQKQGFDRRAFNTMKYWYPLRFKLNYPRKSLLNAYEQKDFLELHAKFKSRTRVTQSEVKLYKKYLHYKLQIEKERADFYNYLREYYKHASEDYEFINHTTERYINEMLNYSCSFVNSYDKFYQKTIEIPFQHLDLNINQKASFQLDRNLVQLGNIQKVIIPSITINNQPNLIIDYNRVSKRAPVAKGSKKLTKIPLYDDKNAEKLALKYNCSIVMTNSAFVCLLYNLSYQNTDELKIPFIIKEIETKDGKKQKIIYIEKPFMPKHLSKREINEKFYKRALITTLVKQQTNTSRFKMDKKQNTSLDHQTPQSSPNKQNYSQIEIKSKEDLNENQSSIETIQILDKTILNTQPNNIKEPETTDKQEIENISELPIKQPKNEDNYESNDGKNHLNNETVNMVNQPLSENDETKKDTNKKINKRTRNSTESENSFSNKKKLKSNYSDYSEEEYSEEEDEDFEHSLVIESKDENQEATKTEETQKMEESSTKLTELIVQKTEKIEEIKEEDENAPKSPTMEEINEFSNITPKVIPLHKSNSSEAQLEAIKKDIEKTTKPTVEEKLSLFDLISKLQDKLIETPSKTNVINQPLIVPLQTNKSSQMPTENQKEYSYIDNIHDNLSYSLWNLNLTQPTRVLVRSSTDGYINTEHSSVNSVVLYSKLEYQPQFGCERLSTKDHCKMWAKSYLRNCCDVFVCRINVFTNRLISVSKLSHEEILPKDAEFNPIQSLNHLRSFFEYIIRLEKNNYLLVKDPNETKLSIMKSSQNKAGSFDLHFYYTGFNAEDKQKPSYWMSIDPELYLPYHHKLNRVPCLFEPAFKGKSEQTPQKGNTPKKAPSKKRKKEQKNKIKLNEQINYCN